jgi:hypothetical protein
MSETPKKRGPKPKDPATKKQSYTLSLTPVQIASLEAKAAADNVKASEFVIKKLKL